jgi:PAS domain S-box-containing protein
MNWIENARRRFLRQWTRLRWRSLRNHAFDSFSIPAPAGIALLDSDFRVLRVNETLADMIGVAPKAMVGQGPSSLIPRIAPTLEPILRSVSRTGIPALNFPVSGETLREPGVIRHWIASVFPLRKWGFAQCIGVIAVDVTDQIQFGVLTEAERLANVGSWEVNVVTGEETWSPNLRRLLGLGPDHTRQSEEAFWALVHPEDREMVRSIIDWAMKDRQPYAYQTRMLLPNGRERVFFTHGKPVLNSSNCIVKRVGVTQDITERTEAIRAILESEEKYRDLVENTQDLICTHDLDGRVLWMNELPARILGYSASDLIGRRIPEMLPPETRNLFAEYIERIRRDGHAEGLMQLVARSGERRTWEYRNTLRTEGVLKPIVRGMAHDITDRKRAEEEIRQAHNRTESVLASVADVHILFDRDWRYLYVNEAAICAIQRPREEILGRTLWELYPDIADTEVGRQYHRTMDDRVQVAFEFHYETRDTWWENRFYPAPEGLAVFANDITDRKRSEEALRKQRVLVQSLFETAKTLTRTLELQDILNLLNFQALTLIEAESAWAGVRTKEGFCCDSFLDGDPFKKLNFTWPPGVRVSRWVLQNKQIYLTNDAEHDDLILPEIREALAIRSVLCVPVFDIHQEVIAFFALNNKKGGFGTDDIAMAQGISTVASIAIQNSLTHRRVRDAEDELRRLSSRLMVLQDDHRRQIAEELHEQTAQDLAGLILSLGHLRRSVPDLPSPSRRIVDESIAIARKVFHETRTLSYKLHDSSLELAGLGVAISSYAKRFSEQTGIDVRTEIPEDLGRLSPGEETTIYRIVQEALTNVHRHSGCKQATIRIHREGERVFWEIEDSGGGMPLEANQNAAAGVGIASMRERVTRHGGSMDIENAPGKGFRIRFQFPIGPAATKHATGGAGHD